MLALLALRAGPLHAQLQTISTEHFQIHFMPGAENTARRTAETAEEVFAPLAAAFEYFDEFQTIHVLVLDSSDLLGNGMADYYSNTIYIWATSLDIELRGTHDWIRNVLTHELTHVMTLTKARHRWPFHVALIQVSRFDANPDISFSFPLYHLNAPRGWAEGIAQYGPHRFGYDTWDSHRDMLLRMAALEDDLLTWEELGSLEDRAGRYYGEMVYNQGYALLLYVADRYGAAKVDELGRHTGLISFEPAVRRVLGVSAEQLYADWKRHIVDRYRQHAEALRAAGLFEGEPLRGLNTGIIEYFPAYSPDGTRLAFISSEDREFAIPYLRLHDFGSGKTRTLKGYVDTRISWSPDGREIVFVRNKEGFNDLFVYDLEADEERRISARLRARDPAFSPDGQRIVFVHNADGTNNLAVVKRDGTGLVYLTNNHDGTQYWAPRWSPDGSRILFNVFRGEDRDIAMIRADSPPRPKDYGIKDRSQASVPDSLKVFPDSLAIPAADTSGLVALVATPFDERDPCWLPDGSGFVFASDRSGIFNLYRYTLATGQIEQLTNVLGGAFAPSVAPDGRVVYSGYHANNHDLYEFRLGEYAVPAAPAPSVSRDYHRQLRLPSLAEEFAVSPYRGRHIASVVPILQVGPTYVGTTFGLNEVSAGVQVSSGEMLGGQEVTGWGLLGRNLRDDTAPNTDFGVFYSRSLLPRVGNSRVFNPSLYVGGRRRQIDNLQRLVDPVSIDTVGTGTLYPVPSDTTGVDLLIPGVEQYLYSRSSRQDLFRNTFTQAVVGLELPLTTRQRLDVQYLFSDYDEDWLLQRYRYEGRVFVVQDGKDISAQLPAALQEQLVRDTVLVTESAARPYYRGLDYYTAHDLGLVWSYQLALPTATRQINPRGRSLAAAYRFRQPLVAGYLVDRGVDEEGNLRDDSIDDFGFPVDAYGVRQDRLVPVRTRLHVSELIGLYEERVGLPFDNTLSLRLLGGIRDIRLQDPDDEDSRILEGRYHWPLRYYLGGLDNLSGYPYFAAWGSSVAYGRAGYLFPIVPRFSARFLNLTLSKLYAELFAEAGAVGNTGRVELSAWDAARILADVGGEVRWQIFSYYRFPMSAFLQVAHPLRPVRELRGGEDEQLDDWRWYFGFGFR